MSDVQIPTIPNHQAFVVDALLAYLQGAGWHLLNVTQVLRNKPSYVVGSHAQAIEIILVSEIAKLEFVHEQLTNQVIRLDIGAGKGPTLVSEWSKLPAFDSLMTAFVAGLPSRMLQGFPDTQLSIDQLRVKFESAGEHVCFAKADWKAEVADEDTLRGYWEWVQAKVEEQANDPEAV